LWIKLTLLLFWSFLDVFAIFVLMKHLTLSIILAVLMNIGTSTAQSGPDMSKMGRYTFVMLTTGLNRTQDSATVAAIQRGHLAHIDSLAGIGMLDIAGPFLDKSDWRGILIFNTPDTARVRALVEQDPAVKSGRLSFRMHPWMAQKGSSLK
jgi:uncharacterized protein